MLDSLLDESSDVWILSGIVWMSAGHIMFCWFYSYFIQIKSCELLITLNRFEKKLSNKKNKNTAIANKWTNVFVDVGESLVGLHCMSPLDACTYMGVDSWENTLQVVIDWCYYIKMII